MRPDKPSGTSRFAGLIEPEMLVALSAVLLSVCGLFISLYEASLLRRESRAAVWPHVEVSASLVSDSIRIWVDNTGLGPARIENARLIHEGDVLAGWGELIDRMVEGMDGEPGRIRSYYSVIGGRVLATDAEPETIYRVYRAGDPPEGGSGLIAELREDILEGNLDVSICYCSVYDECWFASLRDLVLRSRGVDPGEAETTESCDLPESSGI